MAKVKKIRRSLPQTRRRLQLEKLKRSLIGTLPRLRLGIAAAYLFVMPLLIYTGNTSYGYTKIIFSLLVISLLLVLWLVEMMRSRDYRFNLTGLIWPGLALLGAALLSLLHSPIFWGDFQSVVLLIYFFAFALLMANTIESSGDLRLLLGVLLASGALTSLYGLLQYYGALPGRPGASGGADAVLSTLGNKNYFAGFIAYLFVPSLLLLLKAAPKIKVLISLGIALLYLGLLAADSYSAWLAANLSMAFLLVGLWIYQKGHMRPEQRRWFLALPVMLTLALLFYTLTTVGWVMHTQITVTSLQKSLANTAPAWGILFLLALCAVLYRIPAAGLSRRWRYGALALFLVVTVGLGVAGIRWGGDSVKPIFSKLSSATLETRIETWQIGLLMFRDHPLVGAGIGEYKRQYLSYKTRYLQTPAGRELDLRLQSDPSVGYNPRPVYAHNEYVQIAAEMGLLGLLAGALLIVMIFWSALGRVRRSESSEERFMLLALLGGVVAFLSDAFFSFPLHLPANALVLAFLLGALYAPALRARKLEIRLQPIAGLVLTGAIFAIALAVGLFAYRDFQSDLALDQGRTQFAQGNYQAALPNLERSVALSFSPAEGLAWLARTYQALADAASDPEKRQQLQQKSISAFERSLARFDVELSYYQLATLYFEQDQNEKAEHYLEQLLATDPQPQLQADAQYLQALIAFRQQRDQAALALLKALIDQHPDYERARILLAQYQVQQGQYALAKQLLLDTNVIIAKKMEAVNQILHPVETITVPTETYYQAKAEAAQLQQEQETVTGLLSTLP